MKRRMSMERNVAWRRMIAPALVCVAATCWLGGCAASKPGAGGANESAAGALRIGTYDSRAVAIAYGRSGVHARRLDEMIATKKKAVDEGNAKLAAEMDAAGAAQQVRLHLQAFSNAPVDDALDAVRDRLVGVAEAAGVSAIVSTPDYRGANVELVDVTEPIVALFDPDARTLAMTRDCRRQKPIPIEVVAKLPADK
jgi:hypothetical protein